MNAIFDINRFWKLEKRNLFFSKMQYLYILAGFTGVYLLSMLLKVWADFSLSGFIYVGAFIVIVCGPCLFEKSRSKYTGVFDFILPVSSFEKYLSIWLRYVVFIPALLCLLLFVLNTLTGLIPVAEIQEHAARMVVDLSPSIERSIFLILSAQATYLAGYFYFKRYAFAKTSVMILIVIILFFVVGIVIGSHFLSGQEMSFTVGAGNEVESFKADHSMAYTLGYGLASILEDPFLSVIDNIMNAVYVIGLWIVCFFKLRETEI